jgi:hypothetical protein
MDDYRAPHTPGVAQAVWEFLIHKKMVPIIMTPAKIYLAHSESKIHVSMLQDKLTAVGCEFAIEDILGNKVFRIIEKSRHSIYSTNSWLSKVLPPIFYDVLRRNKVIKNILYRFKNLW